MGKDCKVCYIMQQIKCIVLFLVRGDSILGHSLYGYTDSCVHRLLLLCKHSQEIGQNITFHTWSLANMLQQTTRARTHKHAQGNHNCYTYMRTCWSTRITSCTHLGIQLVQLSLVRPCILSQLWMGRKSSTVVHITSLLID